jgi:hypothetical protein
VHSPVSAGPAPENLPDMVSSENPVLAGPCAGRPGV